MELWGHVSHDAKDLVNRMLDKSQETRITIRQMLNHCWFKKMLGTQVITGSQVVKDGQNTKRIQPLVQDMSFMQR